MNIIVGIILFGMALTFIICGCFIFKHATKEIKAFKEKQIETDEPESNFTGYQPKASKFGKYDAPKDGRLHF